MQRPRRRRWGVVRDESPAPVGRPDPGATTAASPWTPRPSKVVHRVSAAYGPMAGLALAFAVAGRAAGWHFVETPLVVLTLPFSVALLLAFRSPTLLLAALGLVALAITAVLRHLKTRPSWSDAIQALVALWIIVALACAGVFVRSTWFGPWPKLRDSVTAFGLPPHFARVAAVERGSEACFISCDEPRVSIMPKTDLSPESACRAIERRTREVAKNIGPPRSYEPSPANVACAFRGDLPSIHSDARLSVEVFGADELTHDPWLPWLLGDLGPRRLPPQVGLPDQGRFGIPTRGTVVLLVFNSGID